MIINISGMWNDAVCAHVSYINDCMDSFIAEYQNEPKLSHSTHGKKVWNFITQHRNSIADPFQTDFSPLITIFENEFPKNSNLRKKALTLFQSIFKYAKFADRDTKGWSAYSLCKKMKWKVCPYCHVHSTRTAIPDKKEKRGFRPQLDHYYSQADYPFLALSLGNLIPCCAQCNGPGFKHTKNFYVTPHPHPNTDAENIRFSLTAKDPKSKNDLVLEMLREPEDEYEISLESYSECEKTENAISTFQLFERYQAHVAEAHRIARAVKEKSNEGASSRDQMCKQEDLPRKSSTILNFDPYDDDHYKCRTLGKMSRDIYFASLAKWP
ncbi:hypothetical protein SAMN05216319_1773 [Duganella sp. CF402]|uniref:hypothetical protein n=1 Tax=unclassified Duganella TaxID=2636909 RepID=UPI0008AB3A96|nr:MULTISPECIES: hypothetical protein [unclassified Duganella]RZT09784.1 hypothetical protein EV582_1855 [Duganella sp. BK701]SEL42966.1 hypothetical protein SAMN05216319_1773 [Duganella sp. CF402]